MTDYWVRASKGLEHQRYPIASGNHGVVKIGNFGTAISYYCSVAGKYGLARSVLSGGYAEAGSFGMAIAGDEGYAKVGVGGTAITGSGGRACAGKGGRIIIRVEPDFEGDEEITVVGYIGERKNGLTLHPDTWYTFSRLNSCFLSTEPPSEFFLAHLFS